MGNDLAKPRMHLGCAAGQIKGLNRMGVDDVVQGSQHRVAHRLGAGRASVHVAMQAALIAGVGQVDLQGLQARAGDGRERQIVQQR